MTEEEKQQEQGKLVPISMTFPQGLIDWLKGLAFVEKRSVSFVARELLEQVKRDKEEKRHG